MTVERIEPIERLMRRTLKTEGGCWLYQGYCQKSGHGTIAVGSKKDGTKRPAHVHRLSWEHYHGPIARGLSVLHKCDVPNCVNPEHLFLGTQADNMADMVAKGRYPRGESNHLAKINQEIADWIRAAPKGVTQKQLADLLGLSRQTVSRIVAGKAWPTSASRAG